jgi:hypothetical protein
VGTTGCVRRGHGTATHRGEANTDGAGCHRQEDPAISARNDALSPTNPMYTKAVRFPSAMPPSSKTTDERWWQGHSRLAIAIIVLIIFGSAAPFFLGYLIEPRGLQFTGTYGEDMAQHEAWASEMAAHLTYQNLLTPEPTPRGLFFNPLELGLGLILRATGIPYSVLRTALAVACAPALAFSLMHLARRTGLSLPGGAAVVALLAGSFAPLVEGAVQLGLIHKNTRLVELIGGDATPTFIGDVNGAYIYLPLAILVLIALPLGNAEDPGRGLRLAAVPLSVTAMVYPFFVPTLGLTAILCALLWAKSRGWKSMLKGIGWLGIWSGPPIMYWALLPHLDPEYGRFAAANHLERLRALGSFSVPVILVSIGLGSGAIIGIPRLFRGNAYQQVLACFAAAFVIALNVPVHPWRMHLFNLSPVLIIATLAAWWPILLWLRRGLRWILAAGFLLAATISVPYYTSHKVARLVQFSPPLYISTGDLAAIQWIADQPGTDVVLARSDLSPLVAARGHHRVVVGHWLWTHQYERRRLEVDAIFEDGADPRSLLKHEEVAWVLVDGDRGVPTWAAGVDPAARFDQTLIIRADRLLEYLGTLNSRHSSQ